MYTICDVVYLGQAQELVLSDIKCHFVIEDSEPMSMSCEEFFYECD